MWTEFLETPRARVVRQLSSHMESNACVYRRFRAFMGLCDGAEQAQGDQFQYGTLS